LVTAGFGAIKVVSNVSWLRSEVKQELAILFSQASFTNNTSIFRTDDTILGHIVRLGNVLFNSIHPSTRLETLHLKIPPKQLAELHKNRKRAIELGLLTERSKVNGTLVWRGKTYPARFNLKGFMRSHWTTSKQWSLRVKLFDGYSIDGFTDLSISKHFERQFPDNQLAARTLSNLGVPAPSHKTVKVNVNGRNWGPMLMEEEFSAAYLERRDLKVAPIVGFQDEQRWITRKIVGFEARGITNAKHIGHWQGKLRVKVLNKKKSSLKSWDALTSMARTIHEGLYFSKISSLELEPRVNIEAFAKSLAVMLTWGDWHGHMNQNIRFYLDPYKAQIVPIPTDTLWVIPLDIDHFLYVINELHPIYYKLLELSSFKEKFIKALTDLDELIENIEEQWQEECSYFGNTCLDEGAVKRLKNNYKFLTRKESLQLLFNSPEHNNVARGYEQNWKEYDLFSEDFNVNKKILIPLLPEYIHARAYSDGELHLFNYTPYPVHIKRIIINESCENRHSCASHWADTRITLQPSTTRIHEIIHKLPIGPPELSKITIQMDISGIVQERVIHVEHYSRKLFNLVKKDQLSSESFLYCKKRECSIGPGRYFVDTPVTLPEGYSLEIFKGTTLLFSPNGYIFIAGGKLSANGTRDKPIYLGPTEDIWGGIYVKGDASTAVSTLKHTTIVGTREFQHRLIKLSGGVTFYGSPVHIQNSSFSMSIAEDALNVVKSSFRVEHTTFRDNRSDAIDSDYSDGIITNSKFANIGGDAIDLSGSNVQIQASNFQVISDKALSVGENSQADLQSLDIVEAGIGIACKDGSVLTGNDVSIVDSSLGDIFVYNKKSFFGGGRLVLSNSKVDIGKAHTQFGSTGLINGQTVPFENLDVKGIYDIEQMQKLTTM